MRRRLPPTVIGILLTFAVLASCGGDGGRTPSSSAAGAPVKVVLGLYSGVSDPAWRLTAAEATLLNAALAKLPRVGGTSSPGGLGYHGFTLVGPDATLVAFDGTVASAGSDPPYFLDDPDRTIERFLLGTARSHITPREFAEVKRALARP